MTTYLMPELQTPEERREMALAFNLPLDFFDSKEVKKYDQNQPRAEDGKWASSGKVEGSLGILRKDMPQVRGRDIKEFFDFAATRGVAVEGGMALISSLRPAQSEYNPKQVAQMPPEALAKPLMVSSDHYVLDGTNRWKRMLDDNPKQVVPVIRIQLPAHKALDLMKEFPKVGYKDVADVGETVVKYDENEPRDAEGKWSPAKTGGMHYNKETKRWDHPTEKVSDRANERLKELKVPVVYTNVQLNPNEKGGLQATGKNSINKTVSYYSAKHNGRASAEKFARIRDFNKIVDDVKKSVEHDMLNPKKTKEERESAAVLRMIFATAIRIGSDSDVAHVPRKGKADYKAIGASTLKAQHVKLDGDKLAVSFMGKSGVRAHKTVSDQELARYIREKGAEKGDRLFDTNADKVNHYFQSIAGDAFTVKDLRTWHGTASAIMAIKKQKEPKNEEEFRAMRGEVAKIVAKHLGNTPAVALKAYIDPAVWHSWSAKWPEGMLPKPKVKKEDTDSEFEEMQKVMDEYFETTFYDEIPRDWRTVPETGLDPDDSDEDEVQVEKAGPSDEPRDKGGKWTVGGSAEVLAGGWKQTALTAGKRVSEKELNGEKLTRIEVRVYGQDQAGGAKTMLGAHAQGHWKVRGYRFRDKFHSNLASVRDAANTGSKKSEWDEIITEEMQLTAKADIVHPFVSFKQRVNGEAMSMVQMVSGLHTSRLSAFGFTVEAEVLGIKEYAISEQMDNRICNVCSYMHGKVFRVDDAVDSLGEILGAEDPDDLKTIQPWPKQDARSMKAFRGMSNEQLVGNNWNLPPFHPLCRGILVPVGKVPRIQDTPSYQAAFGRSITEVLLTPAVALLGIEEAEVTDIRDVVSGLSGDDAIAAWESLKEQYSVDVLEEILGVTEEEVLAGDVTFPD